MPELFENENCKKTAIVNWILYFQLIKGVITKFS